MVWIWHKQGAFLRIVGDLCGRSGGADPDTVVALPFYSIDGPDGATVKGKRDGTSRRTQATSVETQKEIQ